MEAAQIIGRNQLYSEMANGRPIASYKKTILAQAAISVWDNFEEKPIQMIIKGDPRRDLESCIIDVFSEKEKVFFERANKAHFKSGVLVHYQRPLETAVVEKPIEQFTDDQLTEIINSKFFTLQNTLNRVDSLAVLFRMKALAEDNEKSEKIIKVIEARISEVQALEYQPKAGEAEEE